MCFVESDHSIGSVCILLKVIIASDVTLENPINQAIYFCKELDLCLTSNIRSKTSYDESKCPTSQAIQYCKEIDSQVRGNIMNYNIQLSSLKIKWSKYSLFLVTQVSVWIYFFNQSFQLLIGIPISIFFMEWDYVLAIRDLIC